MRDREQMGVRGEGYTLDVYIFLIKEDVLKIVIISCVIYLNKLIQWFQ